MVQPPLAKTNEDVAIFLIIGVIFSRSRAYPIASADTPAMTSARIFCPELF